MQLVFTFSSQLLYYYAPTGTPWLKEYDTLLRLPALGYEETTDGLRMVAGAILLSLEGPFTLPPALTEARTAVIVLNKPQNKWSIVTSLIKVHNNNPLFIGILVNLFNVAVKHIAIVDSVRHILFIYSDIPKTRTIFF